MNTHSVSWDGGRFTRNEHKNATSQKVRRQLTVVTNQAEIPGSSARQWYTVLLTHEELAIDMANAHLPTSTDHVACVS